MPLTLPLPPDAVRTVLGTISPHRVAFHLEVSKMVDAYLASVGDRVREPWTPVHAKLAGEACGGGFDADAAPDPRHGLAMVGRKVAQHLHAAIADDPACVPDHERRAVREALGLPPDAVRATRDDGPDADGPVTFTVPYAHLRHRARTSRDVHLTQGYVRLEQVDARDARVVAVLRLDEGGTVALRRDPDGGFLRPLLAPGSSEPMGTAAFRRACRAAMPWPDDPFSPPARASDVVVGAATVAVPVEHPSPSHDAAAWKAVTSASARAGRLTVVDGIVHRATGAPEAAIACEAVVMAEDRHMVIGHRVDPVWRLPCGLWSGWRPETHAVPVTRAEGSCDPNLALLRGGIADAPALDGLLDAWVAAMPRQDRFHVARVRRSLAADPDRTTFAPDDLLAARVLVAIGQANGIDPTGEPFDAAARVLAGLAPEPGRRVRGLWRIGVPDGGFASGDALVRALSEAMEAELRARGERVDEGVASFEP